jgi:ATP-dependent RNA helicase RhlE
MDFVPELKQAIAKAGFTVPTPIQAQAIGPALTGSDIIGIAQTGTGKTMAFGLPIIQKLLTSPGRALILVPTRELALQVEESLQRITMRLARPLRTVTLIGGAPIYRQIQALKQQPACIIATPGRLRDHLERRTIVLSAVNTLVLDEADRMLDMGFEPQIRQICQAIPADRQTMLFSATMESRVAVLASAYQRNPVRVEVQTQGATAALIEQELCYVHQEEKLSLLTKLLQLHTGTVLVFSRTKHGATRLATQVRGMGHSAAEIHSNRSLGQRREALSGFKTGKYRILVATDVAARGIDVRDISVVVNYDLPDAPEDYVHRIGRTGRAGSKGRAISFATPAQLRDVQAIERLTRHTIALSAHTALVPPAASHRAASPPSRPSHSYARRRR